MAIGPVQLIVLGFNHPEFHGEIASAGGFRIGDGFISPLDLIELGLVSAAEAEELHALEQAAGRA